MQTFSIQTLGCKVNQYESEQIAALLRSRGLRQVQAPGGDVRIVNTCSVTIQAASKSRQTLRRTVSLPTITPQEGRVRSSTGTRVIATGCWATSDRSQATALAGVDAVITHHDDVAAELDRLLSIWENRPTAQLSPQKATSDVIPGCGVVAGEPGLGADKGWIKKAGTLAADLDEDNKPRAGRTVNEKVSPDDVPAPSPGTPGEGWGEGDLVGRNSLDIRNHPHPDPVPEYRARGPETRAGTTSLPLLGDRQTGHQRAFLKIQDGCDAHCTYCIIPQLRPRLWSKSVDDAVEEAMRLVAAGHVEIVLTGIFLGAYGQPTALRRRQTTTPAPIADLIDGLCTRVMGLRRLRLSSLEPGDLTPDLIAVLKSHAQVVPHFHLPLQSGSDEILHRMNRQYGRDDFLRMIDAVHGAFDRPALTTDVITGFPGETDEEFARTLEVVNAARFIHVHAFSFSPRPGTAAARWSRDFVRGPVVNDRIDMLRAVSERHSQTFRESFIGEEVELMLERAREADGVSSSTNIRHGRCERYFAVHFECDDNLRDGDLVRVRVGSVTAHRTVGILL